VTDRSLIRETLDRLLPLMPPERIVVVTGAAHAASAREQLPELPAENIVVEPAARGTGPAIGLGLIRIARMAAAAGDPDPVIGSFHADHVITNPAEFQAVVRDAATVARGGYIVTLGIHPDSPHTGYGYIEREADLPGRPGRAAYKVARFVEKPARTVAEEYLKTGHYSWNSGMFVWQLSTIMDEFARHQPDLHRQLAEIGEALGTAEAETTLQRVWAGVESVTIDVGIAEKSDQLAVIPADFGWSDVGDWGAVAELLAGHLGDEDGNAAVGRHLSLDTHDSLIYNAVPGKLIATIGLDNLVIVDTGDVLLVCDKSRNQDVKKIVESLRAQGLGEYL
jgi:mannose-1-phosphate guanylyltransferase